MASNLDPERALVWGSAGLTRPGVETSLERRAAGLLHEPLVFFLPYEAAGDLSHWVISIEDDDSLRTSLDLVLGHGHHLRDPGNHRGPTW